MKSTNEFQRKLADELRALPERETIGALCLDTLERLAETRVQIVGREYVDARVAARGIDLAALSTDARAVVTALERGPADDVERARIVALALVALDARLASGALDEAERVTLVRRLTWLELATPYRALACVDVHVSEASARALWLAVADAVVAEQGASDAFAANALRLLRLADAEAGGEARESLAGRLTDERLRTLLVGAVGTPGGAQAVRGRLSLDAVPPRTSFAGALRLASGYALLTWIARGLASLLGVRVSAELALVPRGVTFHRTLTMLGRVISDRRERFDRAAIVAAARTVRYPSLHLLVGALGLALGVVLGGLVLVDGVRSGETYLLLVGAGLVLAGAALDLGLAVVLPATRGEVAVELTVSPRRVVRVNGVDADAAEAFLAELAR